MKMRISELAERAGVSHRTLHFYEREGLLQPSQREGKGYRYYDETSLHRLGLILRLKTLGLTLEEIRDVLPLYSEDASGVRGKSRVIAILEGHLNDADEQIRRLQQFRDELLSNLTRMRIFLDQARAGAPPVPKLPEAGLHGAASGRGEEAER